MSATVVEGLGALDGLVGRHLGYSEWVVVDQDRIDRFADVTGDHQWIHVDADRAREGPFGTTVAHGYLTLSLVPVLLGQVLSVRGARFAVNYGCNRVRFPAPLPAGTAVRLGAVLVSVDEVAGGVQVALDVVVEALDAPKPFCAAQVVLRYSS